MKAENKTKRIENANQKATENEAVRRFRMWVEQLAATLRTKARPFFIALMCGVLMSVARRRTVTQWIAAANLNDQFRHVFYHMPGIGRKGEVLFETSLEQILERLGPVISEAKAIRIVIDDSPTKRYGRKIEGAGWHHNPTPGRTDATTCFGHSWVVATLMVTHPEFGEMAFPIAGELYLRRKEIAKLQTKYARPFRPKTRIAVAMVERLVPQFTAFGKPIEVIVDGGYAKQSVLVPLAKMPGVTTITRLRRDAVLFEIPPNPTCVKRGRPRLYGERIDLKPMAESPDGWRRVTCVQYGETVTKQVKSFVATSRMTKGLPLQVVIIKEDTSWVPIVSTDVNMSIRDIIESYAVRFGIEETFKDLKEVWGWGKQEVRLLESNEAATAIDMLAYNLVQLTTWDTPSDELLTSRRACPWDDPHRRPSHADRRKYLRRLILRHELNAALSPVLTRQKIIPLLEKLLQLAV